MTDEHPDQDECICQGRGRYFITLRPQFAEYMRSDGTLVLDPSCRREVFCSLHGVTVEDVKEAKRLGIYV